MPRLHGFLYEGNIEEMVHQTWLSKKKIQKIEKRTDKKLLNP
ncbi:hypothetical protein SAMN02194393_00080 [Maledivibacter halophilus]|uniref:Uncharacterized protein n=1 Tax=Maledivibacter halophilus TaxID=36842 RepID=A0A1T5I9S5_9FIRM|nr:hypothetical protein SAMN02194393_00080 [Maledivibacter halophilus]